MFIDKIHSKGFDINNPYTFTVRGLERFYGARIIVLDSLFEVFKNSSNPEQLGNWLPGINSLLTGVHDHVRCFRPYRDMVVQTTSGHDFLLPRDSYVIPNTRNQVLYTLKRELESDVDLERATEM